MKERDFESPTIVYNPKKSAFDERLKDLRENFSFSLYADLKDRINASSKSDRAKASKEHGLDLMSGAHSFDESLSLAKKNSVKNFKEALKDFGEKIKKSPNDLNAINEAFNHLKTELERVSGDELLKGLKENLASLYADLKDKIHHNALSNDELDRMIAFREQEFEKNLEDLMPSSLGAYSYDESLSLAKKHCFKNCKKALQDFAKKIKKSPNDLNAINEAFDNLETELERTTENLSQKIAPILERYENDKRQALGYGEFLEKEKKGFIVDEQNPYPEEVRFNELHLAEFESVFSVIVPLENLDKPACAHHALKALEAALKNRDLGFDATELEQIAKGFIPKGYLWHFDANVLGNLALVKEELLLSVKHTKGYSLWKQFLQTQN
ncbi:HNH endonuclease [Helicobacter pylori]|uniref:HNH endonuclease signature motif containing protein n=1 Tax=Helicobacter pylori TaxID=210 RepID=UPI001F0FB0A6